MKYRSLLLLFVTASVFFLASYTVFKSSGSHPGSTGAPGELTCAQSGCHVAKVTQDSGTVNTLLFSGADTTYTPGSTYTLTLKVNKALISKFGFELVALKDSTNTNIGTFSLLESTRTQVINHVVGSNDFRFSMTHKTAGTTTSTPGAIQWRMKWTAPSTNVGKITFWYASNCTNNNGQETGDDIYLSHFRIRPFVPADTTITTGVGEYALGDALRAYQDGQSNDLLINFSSYGEQRGRITLYDINGRLILDKKVQLVPGHNLERVRLPENCCEGAYFVKLVTGDREYRSRIILER
jgi:hypothetical protein